MTNCSLFTARRSARNISDTLRSAWIRSYTGGKTRYILRIYRVQRIFSCTHKGLQVGGRIGGDKSRGRRMQRPTKARSFLENCSKNHEPRADVGSFIWRTRFAERGEGMLDKLRYLLRS